MFENLNNPNAGSRNQVDDIFADTDKSLESQAGSGSEIVTRSVGLGANSSAISANDLDGEPRGGNKGFMIAVIVMGVIILGLLGFLVYNKFLSGGADEEESAAGMVVIAEDSSTPQDEADTELNEGEAAALATTTEDEFIDYLPVLPGDEGAESSAETGSGKAMVIDSDGDGLSDEEELLYGSNPNLIDTDGDGLIDYEEVMTFKTNPLKSDTDSDGLTDYQEVKIYMTDPLSPDTDGDSYLDGAEVSSGYNPNGPGKLPEAQ